MTCQGYKSAEFKQTTAEKQYSQYALERNKHLWAGASEKQRRLIMHEARTTMEECHQVMDRHRLGCPICKAGK
jgi:hypothetical protein